jgi:hypothetical protein
VAVIVHGEKERRGTEKGGGGIEVVGMNIAENLTEF